ncbi:MAG: hypothetical protein GXY33_05470 [Phycisphaerae bacterium]|nr:hypothetical protein [Phycisphaerae bacterium]
MLKDAIQIIDRCRQPLVVGHVNPDADCIASVVVTWSVLAALGKRAAMMLPAETVSRKFRFMLDLMASGDPPEPADGTDLLVVVDTALRKRINLSRGYELSPELPICNIDHHLGNECYGTVNWVDSGFASASQMVFTLAEALGISLTAAQASLLYTGLHGDTLGFSLRGTSADALTAAAKLAEAGADIPTVCQKLYRTLSPSEFRLMRMVYDNTRISPSGAIAWSTVTHDELTRAGCTPFDIDEQVTVPRSIDGVRIAILFSEPEPGTVRMNLRSEDDVNILPLARSIGGGGHAQAAGVVMHGSMDQTVQQVIARAAEYLEQLDRQSDDREPANACP